jgi:hypothetical protein
MLILILIQDAGIILLLNFPFFPPHITSTLSMVYFAAGVIISILLLISLKLISAEFRNTADIR